jgi:hypothetical protein
MHALTVAAQGVPGVVAGAGAAVSADAVPRPRARVAAQTVLAAPRRAAQRRVRVGVARSSAVTTDQLLASTSSLLIGSPPVTHRSPRDFRQTSVIGSLRIR